MLTFILLSQSFVSAQESNFQQDFLISLAGQNYSVVNVSHEPIQTGRAISWKLLLTNNVQLFYVDYQTPAIDMFFNETMNQSFWKKEITFLTNYTYKNLTFNISTPSSTNLSLIGDGSFFIPSDNKIFLTIPLIDKEQKVTLLGNFINSPIQRVLQQTTTHGVYSLSARNAFLETFSMGVDTFFFTLTDVQPRGNDFAVLKSPVSLADTTKFYFWDPMQEKTINVPYTLSSDRKTVTINWGLPYTLSTFREGKVLHIYGELKRLDTNLFSLRTNKKQYKLNETAQLITTPNNLTGFFYFLDPEQNITLQKEKTYIPQLYGNYSIEASLYQGDYVETHYASFEVLKPLEETYLLEQTIKNNYPNFEGEFDANLTINKGQQIARDIAFAKKPPLVDRFGVQTLINQSNISQNLTQQLELVNNYTFDTTLEIPNSHVKTIYFKKLQIINNTIELGIEDLSLNGFEQSYAIDPEKANFESATVTVTAKGTELYKCPSWNFATQNCEKDDWFLYKTNLVPGEKYTFEIGPNDPGFGEKIKSDSNEFLVQRGTASGSTAQLTATLTTSVNTSQSFLVHYGVTGSATPDDWQFTGDISSSTGLTFDSYNTVAANVYWEVVTSNNLFVQRGQATLLTNNASATITLPDAIDLSRSFVIVNGRCNSASNANTRAGFFFGNLTGTTTLQLGRGNANLCDSVVDWQVIEWLGATVQSGSTTIADNTDSNTAAISAVNLSNSFLVFGNANYGTDTGMDSNNVQGSFSSTTQLSFTQEPGSTYASSRKDVVWYVVSVPELTVQSNIYTVGALSETTAISVSNMSRAFTSASWWSTGGGQTWGRGQSGVAITAANTLTVYKGQTNQNNDVSWFVSEYGTFEKDYATIQLNNLADDSGIHSSGLTYFDYTPTDSTGIANCTLMVNGTIVDTDTSISNATANQLTYNFPSTGNYIWNITCTEEGFSKLETTTPTRTIHVFEADKFFIDGSITNLTQENVTNIVGLNIRQKDYGEITYLDNLDLTSGSDLDSVINFNYNNIEVDSSSDNRLNASAKISIFNVSFNYDPVVLKDGVSCALGCEVINYNKVTGNFTFNVTGFSTYSAANNSQLNIWDTSDSKFVLPGEQVTFNANYSRTVDSTPLNGTGIYCEFRDNSSGSWSSPINMSFDNVSNLYKTNATYSSGSYKFDVNCKNNIAYENQTLENLYAVGQISNDPPVSILVNPADNASKAESQINFTCDATDDKAIANITLYTNTSGSWLAKETRDFAQTAIINVTWGEDVLPSGEFPNDGEDVLGDSFTQDYRIVEKFDLSSLGNNVEIMKMELRVYVDTLSSSADHRTTIHPYYDNVSYDPVSDNAVTTYDRINDGTAFATGQDICSSSQSIGYSSWIDLGSLGSYYAQKTLLTTDLFSLGLMEEGENDAICKLDEYAHSGREPQIRITYVPTVNDFETNFSVNNTALGSYDWNCKATDTFGLAIFATQNRTVNRVQSYYPTNINLIKPTNSTEFNYSTNVKFNISANDVDGLSNCTLWTDKSGIWNPVNTLTYSGISDWKEWSLTGFTNGTHKYNAYCCDLYNDCAWNETDKNYVILLDFENPSVTSVVPTASSAYNLNDVLNITANVTDNRNVSLVQALLEYNGGSQVYDMDLLTGDIYNATFNIQNLGRVNITIKAYDAENNLNDTETTWINVTYTTNAAIYCESSPCMANESLIQYHGGMTPPEPNQPNTIDSCTDGTAGTYQTDESIDFVSVQSLNGSDFRIGDTVEVNITTYTWNDASDNLNYVYTNSTSSINWKVETYIDPVPLTGFNTYSRSFVLEGDVGVQAIRGSVQYNGNPAWTCGTGTWDDNDDIEFLVQKARESNPPEANLISPNHTTTYYYNDIIVINANVTDQNNLGRTYVKISKGIQNWEVDLLDLDQDDIFTATFSDTQSIGNYSIQLFTIDEFGNTNNSEADWFIVADTGTLEINALGCMPSTVNVTDNLICSANASDLMVPLGTVIANVTYPNGTVESQTVENISDIYNFTFSSTLAGDYDVLWWVNNTNAVSRTDVDTFRINELINPTVLLYSPSPGTEYNTSQNVIIQTNVTDDTLLDTVYAQITLPDTSTETKTLTKQANNITYLGTYYLAYQYGNYSIRIVANDSSGNINNSETTWINVSYVSSGALVCASSPCIVSSALIASKDSLTTPEPNSPNTLDACSDGSVGTYQTDESIENITMRNLNGTKFRGGDTVEVNVTAYCGGTRTNINFVYANDSSNLQWRVAGFQDPCAGAGLYTYSRQFDLDKIDATHAFRAIAKYQGTGVATCGGASRDDNDDFEFIVYKTREYDPPTVEFIQPNESVYQVGSIVPVTLNITEQTDIDYLLVNLTWSFNGSWEELVMNNVGGGIFEANITETSTFGDYTLSVYVNDTQGNLNDTESYTFEVGDAIDPIINSANATPNSTVYGNNITIFANVTDDFAVDIVNVEIEGVNHTMSESPQLLRDYSFNTTDYSAGTYNYTIYANDTNNNFATPITKNFTIEKITSEIQLFLNSTRDNFSLYPDEFVNISAKLITPSNGNIEVYNNSNLLYLGISPSENMINNTPGIYNITAIYPATENYSEARETFFVTVNAYIPPTVTLISPGVDTGDNDGEVSFYYNVSGGSLIENCSVFVNGELKNTSYDVTLNTTESIVVSGLSPTRHYWNITCSDPKFTRLSNQTYYLDVIDTTIFGGSTSNLELSNTSAIPNFFIEAVSLGSINYTQNLDLSTGANVSAVVDIKNNNITIDSNQDSRFNYSAEMVLYDLPYITTPKIYQNGDYCASPNCNILSYKPLSGTLTFNVTHFTSYTTGDSANLTIWDDSDVEGGSITRYVKDQTNFFANYTDSVSGESINGTYANCEIKFNISDSWTAVQNMTFNSGNLLYEYNRSFLKNNTYDWNVACTAIPYAYEPLNVTDNISIIEIPDLTINSMTFSNSSAIYEGEILNITLNITNYATGPATNFLTELNVSFYNGTVFWNETLTSPAYTLLPNTSKLVNFTWTAKIGTYIFEAFADSTKIVFEMNESNNNFTMNQTVSAWQIFYGIYDYGIFLSNAVNETLHNWSATSPEATFFYADVDSSFYPFDLQALSGANDLAEADSALGLTGYSDSVVALFDRDDNGIADNTIDLEIAGSTVYDIPVINTTNTSSFLTGILWDSNDGASYTGAEDLVFFTFLNASQVGYYGTYDFEVRIPSTLETLFGVTNSVEKTVEVK